MQQIQFTNFARIVAYAQFGVGAKPMLEASLGIDTSTVEGWRDLAIVVLPFALLFGFFADSALSKRGFGVIGNGLLAMIGTYLAIKLIDLFIAPSYAINTTGAAILAVAAGGLFLAALSALKRRFS